MKYFQDGKELPKKANESKDKIFVSPLEKKQPKTTTIKKDKLYF